MRTQEKRATRFRSIQTSLLFVIVPAVIISMAVLSLMGYLSSKAIIQTSAGTEMSRPMEKPFTAETLCQIIFLSA